MSVAQPKSSGIVTLTTDFGAADSFVGAMKGVLLTLAPSARIVDITHDVPPQCIERGAIVLAEAAPYFPDGTVHVGVVDPGVGTARRPIAIATERAFFVGPDNGLLSLAASSAGGDVRAFELTNERFWLPNASTTFHGRDIFAPAAAHLAAGGAIDELGEARAEIARLALQAPVRRAREVVGSVVYADRFGNLVTNVLSCEVGANARVEIGSIDVGEIAATYGVVSTGDPVAVFGSNGHVEIAVRNGSAAERFGDSAAVIVRW